MTIMDNWLQQYTDFNVVFAINDGSLQGAIASMQAANRLEGVQSYAIDGQQQMADYILEGKQTAEAAQDPYSKMCIRDSCWPTATLSLAGRVRSSCAWGEKYTTSRKAESSQPMVFLSRVGGFRMKTPLSDLASQGSVCRKRRFSSW